MYGVYIYICITREYITAYVTHTPPDSVLRHVGVGDLKTTFIFRTYVARLASFLCGIRIFVPSGQPPVRYPIYAGRVQLYY